jgi:hypothetical protein
MRFDDFITYKDLSLLNPVRESFQLQLPHRIPYGMVEFGSKLSTIKSSKHLWPFPAKCRISYCVFSETIMDEAIFFNGDITLNGLTAQCFSINCWVFKAFLWVLTAGCLRFEKSCC